MTKTVIKLKCVCGCDHVSDMEIDNGTARQEIKRCGCPDWIFHEIILESQSPKNYCYGMLYGDDLCKRPIGPGGGILCAGHVAALRWKFDAKKVFEFRANTEPATDKQIKYIERLLESFDGADDVQLAIQAFNQWPVTVRSYTKGEAMYFIKCALGEIRQKVIQ